MANEFPDMPKAMDSSSSKSIKELIRKYLSYYPLFIVFLMLSFAAGYAYIRYVTPEYSASTVINVKAETNKTNSNQNPSSDLLATAMNGGHPVINLDNELSRLRSKKLMTRVVDNSTFNIRYFKKGSIRTADIYLNAPFRLLESDIQDSSKAISFTVDHPTNNGISIEYGEGKALKKFNLKWGEKFKIDHNTYILNSLSNSFNPNELFIVEWMPKSMTVYDLLSKVSVNTIGKTSNIQLGIILDNARRGEDILNKMVQEFILTNLEEQNANAQSKIQFIEQRLGNIAQELRGVEGNLADYKGANLIVTGESPTSKFGEPIANINKEMNTISTQLSVLDMIKNYITNPSYSEKLVPSTLGIDDPVLTSLVTKYNEVQLTKQREAPLVAGKSLLLVDLNNQIQGLRNSLVEDIDNMSQNLKQQYNTLKEQGNNFKNNVSTIPQKEKVIQDITREKTIKENLYLYLLQKREEAALSKTSSTIYEQVDLATSYGPISPNKKTVFMYAVLIGLILPIGLIVLREELNEKIMNENAIHKIAPIPYLGELSFIKKIKSDILPILNNSILAVQFKLIRTNLSFLQIEYEKKVILITSGIKGSGNSFVSTNMATMFAKSGSKVALLNFNLDKEDVESDDSSYRQKGIADYLSGKGSLNQVYYCLDDLPTLHFYPAGDSDLNGRDLIFSDKTKILFEHVAQKYDIVIIDAPSLEELSDALLLNKYCTETIFVVRQKLTSIKDLQQFMELVHQRKFKNPGIIFNGVKNSSHKKKFSGRRQSKRKSQLKRLTRHPQDQNIMVEV